MHAELTCPCQVNEKYLWHNYIYHLFKSEFLSNRVTQITVVVVYRQPRYTIGTIRGVMFSQIRLTDRWLEYWF